MQKKYSACFYTTDIDNIVFLEYVVLHNVTFPNLCKIFLQHILTSKGVRFLVTHTSTFF